MTSASEAIGSLFFNPANVGDAPEPRFTGRASSLQCGATLRITLCVDDSQRIVDARFRAAGCSVMVSTADLLTEQVKGKTTGETAALIQQVVPMSRPENSPSKNECADLAYEALLSAIREYSDSARDEWNGDEALICTCFGVSETRIEHEIQSKGLATIQEVTIACNAGAGCRSCYSLIQDILDEAVNRG